ncbi:hypothetical protein BKE38_25865 [Pseudoroseomonas deserti]|uniref:EamA domain-containing protein n=1 Tax=Teichococcus deserti TaxID=1817963 RepID=A0A1V2GW64_9PROT|nr:EamA family transporter [Pseudoroseomonas deserti]ONG45997.1 hypothetical protein BKE38_25865 [Pseudoroseomonas deserti]
MSATTACQSPNAGPARLDLLLFLVMSLVWGSTWIAAKAGINAVPPVFFAACRYVLVGGLLLALVPGVARLLAGPGAARLWLTGTLVNTGTYATLLWGMQHVASGVAGLVNLPMVAIGLYALELLRGEARLTWRHPAALVLGLAGLAVLFRQDAAIAGGGMEMLGILAILAGTFSYCLGSVLSRPLLQQGVTPFQLTGAQAVVGAVGLSLVSAALEPVTPADFATLAEPLPLASLLFMVIFGTFTAYTIYLRLMRNWGASKAGLYAFVSPVVALLLGRLAYDEPLGLDQAAAALLLLGAAVIAVRK